jgi:hypothetical protein
MTSLPVHLCGSVPLASARDVFETVAEALDGRVKRIPDGETGERLDWLQWQTRFLRQCPDLEEFEADLPYRGKQIQFRPRAGVDASHIRIGELGYAETAIRSYAEFAALRRAGQIAPNTRLLVSLPTPLACTRVHIASAALAAVEPAYEAAMKREIDAICAAIPVGELAIQWDVALEFSILERADAIQFADRLEDVTWRLVRLIDMIPLGADAGLHLCYGDSGHKHFMEPKDTRKMVAVSNAVSARANRPLNWVHMPVPRDRDDDAYFAPLAELKLKPETEIYLGLVHLTGGVEATLRRIKTARRVYPKFGIGTECGFGRRAAETIPDLLRVHREASDAGAQV